MENPVYTGKASIDPDECYQYWEVKNMSLKQRTIIAKIIEYWNLHGENTIIRAYQYVHGLNIDFDFNYRSFVQSVNSMFNSGLIKNDILNILSYEYYTRHMMQREFERIVSRRGIVNLIEGLYPPDRILAIVVFSPPIKIFAEPLVYTKEQQAKVAAVINPLYIPYGYTDEVADNNSEDNTFQIGVTKSAAEKNETVNTADYMYNRGTLSAVRQPDSSTRKIPYESNNMIVTIINEHNLTCAELSRRIGSKAPHIRDVANGREYLTAREVIMVCGVFGKSLTKWRNDCPAIEKAIRKYEWAGINSFEKLISELSVKHGFVVA